MERKCLKYERIKKRYVKNKMVMEDLEYKFKIKFKIVGSDKCSKNINIH